MQLGRSRGFVRLHEATGYTGKKGTVAFDQSRLAPGKRSTGII